LATLHDELQGDNVTTGDERQGLAGADAFESTLRVH
jgi:hypothetical protein